MSRLNYSDESYVRTYRRETTAWLLLPWEACALFRLISTKLDRAGVLDLDGTTAEEALAIHTRMPEDVIAAALPHLVKRGFLVVKNGAIFDPDFIEAESAVQSDRVRAVESRSRRRDHVASRNVTGSHEATQESPRRDTVPAPGPSHETLPTVTPSDGAVTKRDTESRESAEPEPAEQNVTQYSTVPTSTVPCSADSARARGRVRDPQGVAEALTMPIGERAARIARDALFASFVCPEQWPEVVAVAQRLADALGQPAPKLLRLDRDNGVRAVVELYAAGYTQAELEQACDAARTDDYMRGKSLGALSPEVVRRLLAPTSSKAKRNRQPDYDGEETFTFAKANA